MVKTSKSGHRCNNFNDLTFPFPLSQVFHKRLQRFRADVMLDPLGVGLRDERGHA